MQQPSNNGGLQFPTWDILIRWSHEHQQILGIQYNPQEFKRLEFIVAVLGTAKEEVENRLKVWRMQQMAAQQQAALEQQMIEQQLAQAQQQGKGTILRG